MSEETQNELIPLKKLENPLQIFNETEMDKIINEIKEKTDKLEPDLNTDKGRKEIAAMAYKVSRSKTALKKLSDNLTEDWKLKTKAVVQVRLKMEKDLDELRNEVRKPLTDWEDEQEKILTRIKESIENIKSEGNKALEFWMDTSVKRLEEVKLIISKWECDTDNLEVEYRFKEAKTISLEKVNLAIEKRTMYDKEQAELKALREADAKRQEEEAEKNRIQAEKDAEAEREQYAVEQDARFEKERADAAEKAKKKAEEAAGQVAAEKAELQRKKDLEVENERKAAIKAKEDAEQATEDARKAGEKAAKRAAEEEREKIKNEENERLADQKRREQNIEHQRKINTEAVDGLIKAGIQKPVAIAAIKAIILGDVPNVKILY